MPRGGEVKKLSDLFEKYKKQLIAPQGSVITAFQEVINDLFGITVSKEQVSYSVYTKILSVRIAGPLKTEIQLRKKEIISHLKGRLGEKSAPKDIL